jgi:hypothetical protein
MRWTDVEVTMADMTVGVQGPKEETTPSKRNMGNHHGRDMAVLGFSEGCILTAAFLGVVWCSRIEGILIQNEGLISFWIIPIVFFAVAMVLERCSGARANIPWWVPWACARAAAGVWLGLSFRAVLVVNEWYAHPAMATWEPLFSAVGLSAAGVLATERWLDKIAARGRGSLAD